MRRASAKVKPENMKLYFSEGHWQVIPVLITARHSDLDMQLRPEPIQTVQEPQRPPMPILKKPKLVESDGLTLNGYECIVFYIALDSLQGAGLREKTLVQLWMRFVEREVVPLLYIWVYPLLGILPYSEQSTERAKVTFKKVMSVLESHLRNRTFMIGERLSLADVTIVSALLLPYLLVLDPTFRKPYMSVNRWFTTCVNIPAFAEALGDVSLCEEPLCYQEGNRVMITLPIRRPVESA